MNGRVVDVVRAMVLADGLGWQNLYRRSRLMAPWTRRKRREIEAEHDAHGIIDEALPFALNQPTVPFLDAPGTNSEWLAFQLQILIDGGGRYEPSTAVAAWRHLAERRHELRVTVGQHAALRNLAAGVEPPISGHDNPHYFDDSACFRAVALVCADYARAAHSAGDRGGLLATVRSDAQISNAHDGVWAAEAFAAALRGALDGGDAGTAVGHARDALPEGCWTSIEVDRALSHAAGATNIFDLIARLGDGLANHAYDYGNTAPETLAIALAILEFTGGELEPSLMAALALPRTAASVAPMLGALCAALGKAGSLQVEPSPLKGLSLPHLAGSRPLSLLDELLTSKF